MMTTIEWWQMWNVDNENISQKEARASLLGSVSDAIRQEILPIGAEIVLI